MMIVLAALHKREMSWQMPLMNFIGVIICIVFKCHGCEELRLQLNTEMRWDPSHLLTGLQPASPVAKHQPELTQ